MGKLLLKSSNIALRNTDDRTVSNRFLSRNDILKTIASVDHNKGGTFTDKTLLLCLEKTSKGSCTSRLSKDTSGASHVWDGFKDFVIVDLDVETAGLLDGVDGTNRITWNASVDAVSDSVGFLWRKRSGLEVKVLLPGTGNDRRAYSLNTDDGRHLLDAADGKKVLETLVDTRDDVAITNADCNVIGCFEKHVSSGVSTSPIVATIELFAELEGDGLLALRCIWVEASAAAVPAELLACLSTQIKSVIIAALDKDNLGTVDKKLSALGLWGGVRNKDDARLFETGADTRKSSGGIAGGGGSNDGALLLLCLECDKTTGTILKRSRWVTAVVLDPDLLHSELLGKFRCIKKWGVANRKILDLTDVGEFDREECTVSPHTHPIRPGSLVLLVVLNELANLGSVKFDGQISGVGMFMRTNVLCFTWLQDCSTNRANKTRYTFHSI